MSKIVNHKELKKASGNYIQFHLTFTSRVIAGWLITIVGLIKLWITSDPTAWLPVVLGGTGMMIVSRGVDRYMENSNKEINNASATNIQDFRDTFTHPQKQQKSKEPEALKKHKEYHAYLDI